MNEDLILIGKRVRDARVSAGLSQPQLAEAAGLSTSFISLIENGRQIMSIKALIAISNALRVSTDWILRNNTPVSEAIVNDEILRELDDCSAKERDAILRHIRLLKQTIRHFSADEDA